jgi:tetratricopeptide (TPR) repeat protein
MNLVSRFGIVLVCAPALFAADQWIKLTTPHFQLYTTAGEKKAREAILYFEQVRSFFLEVSPTKRDWDTPARIVAFKSEKQYAPYRANDAAAAFYTRDENRDYIVMEDIADEHYPVAIHEYTHLVIEHQKLNLPVWLNEGWADVYSTLRPKGKQALVGDLIPGRVVKLMQSKLIPIWDLTKVDRTSPLYNERDKAGLFYAESWALVHMLYLSPEYRPKFVPFIRAIASGKTFEDVCKEVYGNSMQDVQNDLSKYFRSTQFYGVLFNVKLTKSEEEAQVSEVSEFESGLVLADLFTLVHKLDEAERAYMKLAAMNPDSPEVEESLGYLSIDKNDRSAACQHFRNAMKNGSKSPVISYRLGLLDEAAGDRSAAAASFQRALDLKPDYIDARLALSEELLQQREFSKSLTILGGAKKVSDDLATWYFSQAAFDYLQLGEDDQARTNAELAKKWSKKPGDTQQAERILELLDRKKEMLEHPEKFSAQRPRLERSTKALAERPTLTVIKEDLEHIEGKARKLVCAGKSAALSIDAGGKLKTFVIPDPELIQIRHGSSVTFDFSCGPQDGYSVAIDYRKPQKDEDADGIVQVLAF